MKTLSVLVALTLSTTLLSAPAHSSDGGLGIEKWLAEGALSLVVHEKRYSDRQHRWDRHDRHKKRNGGTAVPEMDAAGATLALALLGGIIAIWRERRRRVNENTIGY